MSATSASCARATSTSAPPKLDRAALDEQGYSCIYVAVDGTLAGLVPFTDQIRPGEPGGDPAAARDGNPQQGETRELQQPMTMTSGRWPVAARRS